MTRSRTQAPLSSWKPSRPSKRTARCPPSPQPLEGITYAAKIDKAEARIDLSKPAPDVHNHIRGLSPFPGAWLDVTPTGGKPERLKILRTELATGSGTPGQVLDDALAIACGSGAIRLLEVQRAGKRAMTADEFLRGFAVSKGAILGQPPAS